ncbi:MULTISPECIES: hypothetical protein [unclassified Streptomyces]|uniref:hypothetical protein n=1 Tax=unclassified Streptomyces TaxID=2593676 RepID=UPI0036DFB066
MRSTVIRRTALASGAVCLALLATACGGSDSGSGDGDKADAKGKESAAAKPAAEVLTAAELEKAALAQGDVKGEKITKAAAKDIIAADDITVDKEACTSFARALMGTAIGEPAVSTQRHSISEPKKGSKESEDSEDIDAAFAAAFDITTTQINLASYEGKAAEETIAGLRTAATECSGGFGFTAAGEKQKVSKITEEQVEAGEEALAWTVTVEQDGEKVSFRLVAFRQGATVASFSAFNLAEAAGEPGDYGLPTALVDGQAAKLA